MFAVRIDKDGDGYTFRVQPTEGALEMVTLDSAPGIIAFVEAEHAGAAAGLAWERGSRMYDLQPEQLKGNTDGQP